MENVNKYMENYILIRINKFNISRNRINQYLGYKLGGHKFYGSQITVHFISDFTDQEVVYQVSLKYEKLPFFNF